MAKLFDDHTPYSVIKAAAIVGYSRQQMYRFINGDPKRGTPPSKILVLRKYKNRNKNYLLGADLNKYFELER